MKESELMRGNPLINMNNFCSFDVEVTMLPTILYWSWRDQDTETVHQRYHQK